MRIIQLLSGRAIYKHRWYLVLAAALIIVISCKKPYFPPAVDAPNSFLVVEGVITAGNDSTIIKLSHTVKLADSTGLKPEPGASISVMGDNFSQPLTELTSGVYFTTGLNLNNTGKYHIRITTRDNKVYESAPVEVKITPAIDSITFMANANNLQVLANAHDATNNTRYYRYDYNETWRFHARYPSSFIVSGNAVVPRRPDQMIYNCFANAKASTVVLTSTAKLEQDVVSNAVIATIPATSERLGVRYSILVKQYALSKEGYEFWENLKKNTEQLGSVFDALPSQILGNIHNVSDPAEPVIGYISASTVQTKRVYIDKERLPASFITDYPYTCAQDSSFFKGRQGIDEVAGNIVSGLYQPVTEIPGLKGGPILGYLRSSRECVDCTLRGTTVQPIFWKDK